MRMQTCPSCMGSSFFLERRQSRAQDAGMPIQGPTPIRMRISFASSLTLVVCFLHYAVLAGHAADSTGVFNVLDYGAKGDGTNDDTAAVQKAIDACAAQGGGQVLLPAGTFLTGALTLHTGIDFHLG